MLITQFKHYIYIGCNLPGSFIWQLARVIVLKMYTAMSGKERNGRRDGEEMSD